MLGSLFVRGRFYWLGALPVAIFLVAYLWQPMFIVGQIVLGLSLALVIFDGLMLSGGKISGNRQVPQRFSNGDPNPVSLTFESSYRFTVAIDVIDELPDQFQIRDFLHKSKLTGTDSKAIRYELTPTKRGEYLFGFANVHVRTGLGLLERRFRIAQPQTVAVYPSFLQMRQHELLAISNRLHMVGQKRLRRIGQSLQFEQIKDYQRGDDVRHINWAATARRTELMVNHYQDERSQQIIAVIDKSRLMKFPFGGLTLLDHAINSALVLSNIAMIKHDKAGLCVFAERVSQYLSPDKGPRHLDAIMQALYALKTRYAEASFEALQNVLRNRLNQRSLLMLYTNFEERDSLERQLPYLRWLSKRHVLVVVFFENVELSQLSDSVPIDSRSIYLKTIARGIVDDKKLMQKELQRLGIHTFYTRPENLTINSINKYLELKGRNVI